MSDYSFKNELLHWGPSAEADPPTLADSQSYCRRITRSHYENFPVVSWLLPRKWHQDFYNVYAWCRWADDLGDEVTPDLAQQVGKTPTELLDWWREELLRSYAGEARHPVTIALTNTIHQCKIPQQPFLDLISAFQQDQVVTEYESWPQLLDYCRRSADPVGRLVLYVCEAFTEERGTWSDSICSGLQVTNFWQDVARDDDKGRIYLPREDREQFGYSREDFNQRLENDSFRELMIFEVNRARELMLAGNPLISQLNGRLKKEIHLFQLGGLRILEKIEQIDYRVWTTRPKLNRSDLPLLLFRAMFGK
ncbi:All-trans-phytoene synthase [Polystyrenella longa]|uniref:All-trans-phytoene synthase n=1 Tax=Polystyrenella longa TaxID=2528007 RepID=A0A518CJF1_9PLAN|nr:squalene synthase HpnC [Polystyrenella longa]QDU79340.1 All-trans-phytoene synthase [Polystyrenella longa]